MLDLKKILKMFIPDKVRKFINKIRYTTLVDGPLSYKQDGLYTLHNCDFLKDKLFLEAFNFGRQANSWKDFDCQWRAHVIFWAASIAKNLEGDFVECGVNRGAYSRGIIHYVDFGKLNKKFYLIDTFCGLSEKYILPKEKQIGRKPGGYEECYEAVKQTFKNFPNVEIIRGIIPDVLPSVKIEKIAYLSIDMNCVIPEIAAAEYFWDKIVKGGIIVLDDYGYSGYLPQKNAFDEFAEEKKIKILQLPTGQGLIIKC